VLTAAEPGLSNTSPYNTNLSGWFTGVHVCWWLKYSKMGTRFYLQVVTTRGGQSLNYALLSKSPTFTNFLSHFKLFIHCFNITTLPGYTVLVSCNDGLSRRRVGGFCDARGPGKIIWEAASCYTISLEWVLSCNDKSRLCTITIRADLALATMAIL
jgi:hypothetical protein